MSNSPLRAPRRRCARRGIALAVVTCLCASAAHAGTQAPDSAGAPPPEATRGAGEAPGGTGGPSPAERPVFTGETVVVVAERRSEGSPDSPTAAASRVDLAERPRPSADLSSALLPLPSVALHRYGGPGSMVSVAIRGSASDQVQILLGSIPLTPPGGGFVDLSALPPTLLSAVIASRGAEGALRGAGALGGVVYLEPIGAVGSGASGPCLSLTLEGGSFGTVAGALTAQGTAGSWQVAGGVDLRRSDGDFLYARDLTPNLPDDPWVVEQRRNNASAAATVLVDAVRSGDEGRTRITVLGHRGERGAPGLVGYPTAGATSEATRLAAGLETAGRSSAGPLALTTWLSYDAQAYDPGEDPAPGAGSAAAYGRSTVGAQLVQHVARGPHHLRLGLRGETESLEISQARRWTRVPARAAAALYGAETYALGPAWTLLGALRIEAWSDGPLWLSPRLGARYDPPRAPGEAGFALFANLGQGVRMPTLFERYGESAFLRPNPELRPERAWTVDLGAEWRGLPGGGVGLSLRGALFASLYEDLITYELFPPFRLKPFNTRSARILGAEVEASLSWGPLRAWLAYAFTEARALSGSPWEAGRALPYRPPHRGSGGCVLSVWRLEIFTEAEGQSTYARNRTETLFVPGWITLATGLRLRLTERFEFSAVVENLLDDQRRQDVFGFPLPGRSFLASLRFTPPLGD